MVQVNTHISRAIAILRFRIPFAFSICGLVSGGNRWIIEILQKISYSRLCWSRKKKIQVQFIWVCYYVSRGEASSSSVCFSYPTIVTRRHFSQNKTAKRSPTTTKGTRTATIMTHALERGEFWLLVWNRSSSTNNSEENWRKMLWANQVTNLFRSQSPNIPVYCLSDPGPSARIGQNSLQLSLSAPLYVCFCFSKSISKNILDFQMKKLSCCYKRNDLYAYCVM